MKVVKWFVVVFMAALQAAVVTAIIGLVAVALVTAIAPYIGETAFAVLATVVNYGVVGTFFLAWWWYICSHAKNA